MKVKIKPCRKEHLLYSFITNSQQNYLIREKIKNDSVFQIYKKDFIKSVTRVNDWMIQLPESYVYIYLSDTYEVKE